eukprot:6305444-Alexandrium_andersonii.AAC.1
MKRCSSVATRSAACDRVPSPLPPVPAACDEGAAGKGWRHLFPLQARRYLFLLSLARLVSGVAARQFGRLAPFSVGVSCRARA